MERITVEQFGLVRIAPDHPRVARWVSMSATWSLLISGTSSGTSGAIRWLRELLTTTCPALAKASSISPATEASMAEKTSSGAPLPGRASCTTRSASSAGGGTGSFHDAASRYFCPADRSLAPTQVSLNQGCAASCAMNCWPTIPVAPRTPTSIRCDITVLCCSSAAGTKVPAYALPGKKKPAGRLWPRRRVLVARCRLASSCRASGTPPRGHHAFAW